MNSYVYSTNSSSVKYKWIIQDLILFTIFLVPGLTFFKTTGDLTVYFRHKVLDGQFLYVVSKFLGLYALIFLWLQVLKGLLGEYGDRFLGTQRSFTFHRNLGLWIISLFMSHAVLFVWAVSIRNNHFASGLLIPHFLGSYYPSILSLGLIASWLMILSTIFAALRQHLPGIWKWGHRLSVPSFFLVLFHSYFTGSETRAGAMVPIYYWMFATVVFAICYRLWKTVIKLQK